MSMSSPRRRLAALALGASSVVLLAACAPSSTGAVSEGSDTGTITLWTLDQAGPEADALTSIVSNFEADNKGVTVEVRGIPAPDYTQTVLSTPVDELPDVLLVDGPAVPGLAYNGKIAPLSEWVSEETLSNQTDAVAQQNTYNGDTYAISTINSGLGLWANTSMLEAAGVTLPTSTEDAWTIDEFHDVLVKLAAQDPDGKSLTIAENQGLATEYGSFAFDPVLWSAGATIFSDGKAEGALDSPAAVDAVTQFAALREYTDPDTDGQAFQTGRVALAWMGHWQYPAYAEALGDDLEVGPLPDFGQGTKSGAGSIAWGMGASTQNAQLAATFLDYMAQDDSVAAYSEGAGAPPATTSGLAASVLYGPSGPLALLGDQLSKACPAETDLTTDCVSVVRPVTPGYPIVSLQIGEALSAIWGGADPQDALSEAARAIDRDFTDNNNYQE